MFVVPRQIVRISYDQFSPQTPLLPSKINRFLNHIMTNRSETDTGFGVDFNMHIKMSTTWTIFGNRGAVGNYKLVCYPFFAVTTNSSSQYLHHASHKHDRQKSQKSFHPFYRDSSSEVTCSYIWLAGLGTTQESDGV